MKIFAFLEGVFSDNGQPSFSRVGAGFALAFACGWVTAIVWKTHALPDFMGLTMFIGSLYGVNVVGSAFKPKTNQPDQPGQPNQGDRP